MKIPVLLALALATHLHAASIVSVNFTGGGFGGSPAISLLAAEMAGVIPAANYNNIPSAIGANLPLVGDDGLSSPITLTIAGSGLSYSTIGGAGINPQGGDEKLNTGILAGNNTLTLSGIPYAAYDIYIYALNDNETRIQTTTIGTLSYYHDSPNAASSVDQNINTPYNYVRATSTTPGSPTANANYVRFSDLSGNTKTITISAPGNGFVNGLQVVQVPEPGTGLLGMLGSGVLFGILRRRRD